MLTLHGVTQADFAELGGLNGSEFINGGGGNNGPTINGAGNTVNYTGTPVTLDNNLTISDTATITNLTATISSGAQSGDTLTINGTQTGTLTNGDGSTIAYNFYDDVMTLSVAVRHAHNRRVRRGGAGYPVFLEQQRSHRRRRRPHPDGDLGGDGRQQ